MKTLVDIPPEIIDAAYLIKKWAERHAFKDWVVAGIGPRETIIDRFQCPRCDDVHVCRPTVQTP